MLKSLVRFLAVILLFLVVVFLAFCLMFLLTPIVRNPSGIRFDLNPGTSLNLFAENLHQQGIINHPRLFIQLVRLKGKSQALKAGVYQIQAGTTPLQLIEQVTTGKGLLYHAFTIVPGWTYQQLKSALNQAPALKHDMSKMNEQQINVELGNVNFPLEGMFYPDTYYYPEGASDIKLLRRAFMRMQAKLQEAWMKRDSVLPYQNSYQALIAASLVEKETSLNSERPVIAGVLLNRLQRKMLLQFDPTVIYGVMQSQLTHKAAFASFKGILRRQDLKLDSPYNTYLHKGLPPTPIAMPSIDSIQAVLHPVLHQYLYFVANGIGHQFSQSLAEHNTAVKISRKHEAGFFNYMLMREYILKTLSILSPPSVNSLSSEFAIVKDKAL
jgi:UPF0755 protein